MLRLDTELLKEKANAKGDTTHDQIARRAGIDRSVVTRVFMGNIPTLVNVTAIAWAYEISLDDLVPKVEAKVGVPA
ncbi:helix-turn-helix domain-containing protein [Streptomyces collinus]|uniref:helix-turn-helix domain-containing protein n=1 Tax=Streptomyces collinus TaxID=42684 RepID=UPI00367EFA1D